MFSRYGKRGNSMMGASMTEAKPKMTFTVNTRRVDAHGSLANSKEASITLGTVGYQKRDKTWNCSSVGYW